MMIVGRIARQRHMEHTAEPSGAIHCGRVVQRRVHAGKRRQINDRVPADASATDR